MTAAEVNAKGYAVAFYDIAKNENAFRFGADSIELPVGSVRIHPLQGFKYQVAKWDDVKAAHG